MHHWRKRHLLVASVAAVDDQAAAASLNRLAAHGLRAWRLQSASSRNTLGALATLEVKVQLQRTWKALRSHATRHIPAATQTRTEVRERHGRKRAALRQWQLNATCRSLSLARSACGSDWGMSRTAQRAVNLWTVATQRRASHERMHTSMQGRASRHSGHKLLSRWRGAGRETRRTVTMSARADDVAALSLRRTAAVALVRWSRIHRTRRHLNARVALVRQRLSDETRIVKTALRGWRHRALRMTAKAAIGGAGRAKVLQDFFGSLQELQVVLSDREMQLGEQQALHDQSVAECATLRAELQVLVRCM